MSRTSEADEGGISEGPAAERAWGGTLAIYLLATLVGALAGSLGAAFHYCVEGVVGLHSGVASPLMSAAVGLVMVGGAFSLVRRLAPETAGSGIQEIEGAMAGLRTLRWVLVIPVKFVGGVLAIGAGLVLGREGPTIHMGGAVGRLIGEKAKVATHPMNTLLAAGAAAGLSAAFSAPLAGILFVTEEMRRRFHYDFVSLHAVALASFTSFAVNDQVFGMKPALPIELQTSLPMAGPLREEVLSFLALYLGLGVVIGVCGAGFNSALLGCLRLFDRLRPGRLGILAALVGGVAGTLLVIAPRFVGGGENLVEAVFADSPAISFLVGVLLLRAAMTFLSYSLGVPGGIFAPMLALGAPIGMIFGLLAHQLLPGLELHAGTFALAAMGALFAATVRAPLTGIILVAEMTSSFELLPPLIITCVVASIMAQLLGSKPVYELLLARTLESGPVSETKDGRSTP